MKITKKQQKALITHLRKKLTQWSSTNNKPADTQKGICDNLKDEIIKFLNLDMSIFEADIRGVGEYLFKINSEHYEDSAYCIKHPSKYRMVAYENGKDTTLWHQTKFENKDDKEYIRRRIAACQILAKAPMTFQINEFNFVTVEFGV